MSNEVKSRGLETIRWALTTAWYLGFLGVCPAFMTCVGYGTDSEWLMRWTPTGTGSAMALNTAISLMSIGAATMITSQTLQKAIERRLLNGSNPQTYSGASP